MTHHPHELYTADQVRTFDRLAIEEFGISGFTLMTRAGEAAYDRLTEVFPNVSKIAVVCGTGNNGGDGFVLARLARSMRKSVSVFLIGDDSRIEGDALTAFDALEDCEVELHAFSPGCLRDCDIIVDAIFGTGLARPVDGDAAAAIAQINASGKPVVAMDLPSGLSADTGVALGLAVRASATVTFVGMKRGLLTADGPDHAGKIFFHDLGLPVEARNRIVPSAERMDTSDLSGILPSRRRNAHKGDFGHVLVIGGNEGFLGAAILCATAAARSGAGLVSVATRAAHAPLIPVAQPEIMAHGIEDVHALSGLMARATVIAIGPGLGHDDWARDMLTRAFASDLPLVADADALNLIAESPRARKNWVITPHPGEAARLLGISSDNINKDRFRAAQELQKKSMATVVLKGCGTIVCDAAHNLHLCSNGNPGMATGGTGDVLTGIIAGLIAQGLSCDDATKFGVCLHARAGDAAASTHGEAGMLASDVIRHLKVI